MFAGRGRAGETFLDEVGQPDAAPCAKGLRELFLGDSHGGTRSLVVAGPQPALGIVTAGLEDLRDKKRLELLSRVMDLVRIVLTALTRLDDIGARKAGTCATGCTSTSDSATITSCPCIPGMSK